MLETTKQTIPAVRLKPEIIEAIQQNEPWIMEICNLKGKKFNTVRWYLKQNHEALLDFRVIEFLSRQLGISQDQLTEQTPAA